MKNSGRTNDFDLAREKQVSKQILKNHMSLYEENWYEYALEERYKRIELQDQINMLYKQKYRFRSFLYRNKFVYQLLHFGRKR